MLQIQAIENVVIIAVRLYGADILGPCTVETARSTYSDKL